LCKLVINCVNLFQDKTLENARIDVEILSEGKSGKVNLSGLNGRVTNLSNTTTKGYTDMSVVGLMLGSGRIEADIRLSKDQKRIEGTGSLTQMDLTTFNQILEPSFSMKVN